MASLPGGNGPTLIYTVPEIKLARKNFQTNLPEWHIKMICVKSCKTIQKIIWFAISVQKLWEKRFP